MDTLVKILLDNWHKTVADANKLINKLTDEQLQSDVAPGRNSGVYLLGHLAAVNDRLLPLLGFGEAVYPHYSDIFLASPDKSGKEMPPITEIRAAWHVTVATLNDHFKTLSAEEWMQKHNSVSAEDFAREPHRNKINVVLNRTMHLNNHLGQMIFLDR